MIIEELLAECTAYDYKEMLEESKPKSYTTYYYVGDVR